jgi:hypothetical protein
LDTRPGGSVAQSCCPGFVRGSERAEVSDMFKRNSSMAEVESWTANHRRVEDVIRTTHSYRTDYDGSILRVNAKTTSDVSFIQGEFWNVFSMYKRAQNSVNTAAVRIAKCLRYGRLAYASQSEHLQQIKARCDYHDGNTTHHPLATRGHRPCHRGTGRNRIGSLSTKKCTFGACLSRHWLDRTASVI